LNANEEEIFSLPEPTSYYGANKCQGMLSEGNTYPGLVSLRQESSTASKSIPFHSKGVKFLRE